MKSKNKIFIMASFFIIFFIFLFVGNVNTSSPETIEDTTHNLIPTYEHKESPTKSTRPPEPPTEKIKSEFSKEKLKKIETATDKKLKSMEFNGTFLIAVGDEVIYHKAMGYSDAEKKIKNTLNTKYEIGSCTKQFTAAAVAKLEQEKKLSLNDSVTKYIKELKIPKSVKIHHLINMSSGLPDYLNQYIYLLEAEERDADSVFSDEELIEWVNSMGMNFNPGDYFSYCNTNYYLLGMIIEKVSGTTYENYIHDNILYPLYMDDTSMRMSDTDSKGYLDNDWTKGLKVDSSYFYSAGEIVSTTSDMLKWVSAYANAKVLSEDTLKKATNCGRDGYNYGYGWFVTNDYYYHTGNTELYYAIDIVTKKRQIKIIGLTNVNNRDLQQAGLSIMSEVEKELFPQDIATQPPTQPPTQKPTQKPTEKPTQKPTLPPTQPPTEEPTLPQEENQSENTNEETTQNVTETTASEEQ